MLTRTLNVKKTLLIGGAVTTAGLAAFLIYKYFYQEKSFVPLYKKISDKKLIQITKDIHLNYYPILTKIVSLRSVHEKKARENGLDLENVDIRDLVLKKSTFLLKR